VAYYRFNSLFSSLSLSSDQITDFEPITFIPYQLQIIPCPGNLWITVKMKIFWEEFFLGLINFSLPRIDLAYF